MTKRNKSLTVSLAMNLINRIAAILVPLITFPYVFRVLDPEYFGRVVFAQSIITYFAIIAILGLPTYGMHQVARCRDDRSRLSILSLELCFLHIVGAAVSFCGLAVYMFCSRGSGFDQTLLWICSLSILAWPLGFSWLFTGMEEFKYLAIKDLVLRVCVVICIFTMIHTESDYRIFALITVGSQVLSSMVNVLFLNRYISIKEVSLAAFRPFRHLKAVAIMLAGSIAFVICSSLDKTMLGYMSGMEEVGLYAVADKVVMLALYGVVGLIAVSTPRSSYYHENETADTHFQFISKVCSFLCFGIFPVAALILLLADFVMPAVFGVQASLSVPLVRILAVGLVFSGIYQFIIQQILYPKNLELAVLKGVSFAVVLNGLLNWILIPAFGGGGAAVATVSAQLTIVVCMGVCLFRAERRAFLVVVRTGLRYSSIAAVALVIAFAVGYYCRGGLSGALLKAGVFVVVYMLSLCLVKDPMLMMIAGYVLDTVGKKSQ